jgi:hypothetical protein
MKALLRYVALALALPLAITLATIPANAKGCIRGALVGGVAGHLAHHGLLGAAAGCVIGHHWRTRKRRRRSKIPLPARSSDELICHCALMPAALMIGHHFSISAF